MPGIGGTRGSRRAGSVWRKGNLAKSHLVKIAFTSRGAVSDDDMPHAFRNAKERSR